MLKFRVVFPLLTKNSIYSILRTAGYIINLIAVM